MQNQTSVVFFIYEKSQWKFKYKKFTWLIKVNKTLVH